MGVSCEGTGVVGPCLKPDVSGRYLIARIIYVRAKAGRTSTLGYPLIVLKPTPPAAGLAQDFLSSFAADGFQCLTGFLPDVLVRV